MTSSVLTGIDVLIRDGFAPIRDQRVGLITNQTGVTRLGRSTVDVLHDDARSHGVRLSALFGPEHGIRGDVDAPVRDGIDSRTGLPVYSLYGETTRPKADQLQGLDALVFDIQDVGCRYYTYTTTLLESMEEAARHSIHFVVLDRPNPINGLATEGPVADADRLSFVACHPIPVRYGMTCGELARMFNAERRIGAGLVVVPCEGWRRGDWWDATGLMWIDPSPNMRSLTEAALYPGIGLLEFTNLSVGRGTDTPFEVFGAPWLDGRLLADALNACGQPGVRFIPIRFTPRSSKFQGEVCGGVNILVTARERFRPVRTGMEIAVALRRHFRDQWDVGPYDRLLVNSGVLTALVAGADASELVRLSQPRLDDFRRRRRRFLIHS